MILCIFFHVYFNIATIAAILSHLFLDIDECAEGKHNCSPTAVCKNTKGSYNCTCNPGYYGDGTYCKEGEINLHRR